MTADAQQSALAGQLADAAQDRTKLLAALACEAAKPGVKSGAKHITGTFIVVRQVHVKGLGEVVDVPVSGHRFAWVAQLCAHRRERQHAHEAGGHYTVRRADA